MVDDNSFFVISQSPCQEPYLSRTEGWPIDLTVLNRLVQDDCESGAVSMEAVFSRSTSWESPERLEVLALLHEGVSHCPIKSFAMG